MRPHVKNPSAVTSSVRCSSSFASSGSGDPLVSIANASRPSAVRYPDRADRRGGALPPFDWDELSNVPYLEKICHRAASNYKEKQNQRFGALYRSSQLGQRMAGTRHSVLTFSLISPSLSSKGAEAFRHPCCELASGVSGLEPCPSCTRCATVLSISTRSTAA